MAVPIAATSTTCAWSAACRRPPSAPTRPTCASSRAGRPKIERWAEGPEPALEYLAGLGRPPRPLRPASHRRKAASIRAFYRFCFAEELIERDVAGLLDLPRQTRQLPDTLDVAQVEALLAAPDATQPVGIRDRALLELLYAAGLRISEALGLDREDLSLDGGFVRVIGKGDRERLVPVGDVALNAPRRRTWTRAGLPRPWLAAAAPSGHVARRAALPLHARPPDGPHGRVAAAPALGVAGRPDGPCVPAYVAS